MKVRARARVRVRVRVRAVASRHQRHGAASDERGGRGRGHERQRGLLSDLDTAARDLKGSQVLAVGRVELDHRDLA